MNLRDLEQQITALQQQAEAMRTTLEDPELPAAWRKLQNGANWYRYLQLTPAQGELFKRDGWEPLYRRQRPMDSELARNLARNYRGVGLVREVERHHGIH